MTSTASALGKKKRFIIVKRKAVEYEEAGTSSEEAGTSSEGAGTTSSEGAGTTSSEGAGTSSEGASRLSEYIAQLTEQEIIVMKIAAEHLKTSFDLEKSSGYLQYLRKQ